MAVAYDCLSAAEQNSLNITWNMLMKDQYKELRRAIYTNKADLERFRGLLVHTVLVTDIVNKDLQSRRKLRWNRVFGTDDNAPEDNPGNINQTEEERKSERRTALLELVIQASDGKWQSKSQHAYFSSFLSVKFSHQCFLYLPY